VLQLGVAAAMVLGKLPPVLRSLHEATGVSIWIETFALAYLARIASGSAATEAAAVVPSARYVIPSAVEGSAPQRIGDRAASGGLVPRAES
jgi:hypothetical protein